MSLSMRDKMDEIILGDIIFTPLKRTLTKGGCVFKIRNKEAEVLSLLCTHYPEALLVKISKRKYGKVAMLLIIH